MKKILIKQKDSYEWAEFIFAGLPCRAEFRNGELSHVVVCGTTNTIDLDTMDGQFNVLRTYAQSCLV